LNIILYLIIIIEIFSWYEKKNVQPTVVSIPVKNQRHSTMATKVSNNIPTITPMTGTNIYSDLKSSLSNDLASKVKAARR